MKVLQRVSLSFVQQEYWRQFNWTIDSFNVEGKYVPPVLNKENLIDDISSVQNNTNIER